MRVLPTLAASLALLTSAQVARADPAPQLREGDRAMESLDYGRAIAAFERAAADRDAQAEDLVRAFMSLVRCQVVLGNEVSARASAEQLLELDPAAEIVGSNVPPRVTRFFEEFKRSYRPTLTVTVEVHVDGPSVAGSPWRVSARVTSGRRAIAGLRMQVRFGSSPEVASVMFRRTERAWAASADVPQDFQPQVDELHYWVEALSVSGAVIGGLGSSDEPMIIVPTRGRRTLDTRAGPERTDERIVRDVDSVRIRRNEQYFDRPLTSKWWFWTAIGAVLIGGVVTTLVLTDTGEPARHGQDGDVQLP